MTGVLTFIEVRDGIVKRPSLEALSEASRLAARLNLDSVALLVGSNITALTPEFNTFGARKVFVADDVKYTYYLPEIYARLIFEAAKKTSSDYIFFSATAMGKDLAPQVAALFQTTVLNDCVELAIDQGGIIARRPVYAAKAHLYVRARKKPVIVSLRPNVFVARKQEASPVSGSSVEELKIEVADLKTVVEEIVKTAKASVELTEASIVVTGGRGLKGPENFSLRDQLAAVLDAACGATRAVVDAGWRPYQEQVGQTGKTVCPNLYIALGVSGAIQHLAGISSSKVIVAINKDPDAPIFKIATYGIVGDVFEVVPVLIQELKRTLGK